MAVVPVVLPDVTVAPPVVRTSQLYVTVGLPAGVPADHDRFAVDEEAAVPDKPKGVPGDVQDEVTFTV